MRQMYFSLISCSEGQKIEEKASQRNLCLSDCIELVMSFKERNNKKSIK